MSETVNIIFPHQLFEDSPFGSSGEKSLLVEEYLFFRQYGFHKQKIVFHRASMKAYAGFLEDKGLDLEYVDSKDKNSDIRELITKLSEEGTRRIRYIDPTDDWLEKRIRQTAEQHSVELERIPTQLFLSPDTDKEGFFNPEKKKFYQTSFYKSQRKSFGYLLENGDEPLGGKWTYDTDNREKYPEEKEPPALKRPEADEYFEDAVRYVEREFSENPGYLSETPLYPHTFKESKNWLDHFLDSRFNDFGPYEDAIVRGQPVLNHSLLSPMINTGLITAKEVLDRAMDFAEQNDVPINSVEGFLRQILGWREFIRGVYEAKGAFERTRNFWGFKRKIPPSFYEGNTGIEPVDVVIKRVLRTGYCHHIERLMVLGNFMLLCEFDPDEVYRWFMELFIDSYDWVMVPNVYGMSQFADGGLMSTKPYISGSNYILKMSDFKKGDWAETWDGLFWRFMDEQREFFSNNPRMRMLLGNLDRMDSATREGHMSRAEEFLNSSDIAT